MPLTTKLFYGPAISSQLHLTQLITLNLLAKTCSVHSVLSPFYPGEAGGGGQNTPQPPSPATPPPQTTSPDTMPTPATESPPPSGLYFYSVS